MPLGLSMLSTFRRLVLSGATPVGPVAPAGFVILTRSDGTILTRSDGTILIKAAA